MYINVTHCSSLTVTSPQMYFGSSTGVFRIFPARQSRECGVYDPRLRPWYQAAVSTFLFALLQMAVFSLFE